MTTKNKRAEIAPPNGHPSQDDMVPVLLLPVGFRDLLLEELDKLTPPLRQAARILPLIEQLKRLPGTQVQRSEFNAAVAGKPPPPTDVVDERQPGLGD